MFWRSPPRPMSLSSGPSSPCSRVSTVSRSVPCSSYPGVYSHTLNIQLNLFCSGSPLEDEVNLAALENLTVDLTVPLLGGKVHGSLARAGKVRGQTPKVSFKRNILLCFAPQICNDDIPMHHSDCNEEKFTTYFLMKMLAEDFILAISFISVIH